MKNPSFETNLSRCSLLNFIFEIFSRGRFFDSVDPLKIVFRVARATQTRRVSSVPFSCRHSLYRSHSSLSLSLLSLLVSLTFFFSPFFRSRSFSHSAFLSLSICSFLSATISLQRLVTPGKPQRIASVPRRSPLPPTTATTRVYKLDQPGSTYLPFRIIRLACRPLLHAEFRLIKMGLWGPCRVCLRSAKTLDLNGDSLTVRLLFSK